MTVFGWLKLSTEWVHQGYAPTLKRGGALGWVVYIGATYATQT